MALLHVLDIKINKLIHSNTYVDNTINNILLCDYSMLFYYYIITNKPQQKIIVFVFMEWCNYHIITFTTTITNEAELNVCLLYFIMNVIEITALMKFYKPNTRIKQCENL